MNISIVIAILEIIHSYDTVFKEIEEEEKEERTMESKLDIVSKSELLAEMPVLFRLAAKLVFLFESDSHPIKFILKWVAVVASIGTGMGLTLNFQIPMGKQNGNFGSRLHRFTILFMAQCRS